LPEQIQGGGGEMDRLSLSPEDKAVVMDELQAKLDIDAVAEASSSPANGPTACSRRAAWRCRRGEAADRVAGHGQRLLGVLDRDHRQGRAEDPLSVVSSLRASRREKLGAKTSHTKGAVSVCRQDNSQQAKGRW